MPLLLGDPYRGHGCAVCRDSYLTRQTIDDVVGSSAALQSDLYRCRVCDTWWQETGRGIAPITPERAAWALAAKPESIPPPPEFVVIDDPPITVRGGLVAEPSAPAWEPGLQPMARWRANVLAAIAAELGLPAPYLLRWTTQRAGAMTAEGYGLIAAVDGLDWTGLHERMLLSAGIGPDVRSPMARRIGFGSASSPVEGPNEIVAVGADARGRNAVQARERDYERWRG